jgi:membrane associated rhomboid family serine protease
MGGGSQESLEEERQEQAWLNQLADELVELRDSTPFHKYGYKPSEGGFKTLITSMFLHGDFGHIIGNLLFFFVTGPFLEDVLGRPLFTFLYFTGGMIASWTHAWQHPGSDIPLIGASGAIAAVMGAYLIRFARSKIEFIWIPIIIRPSMHVRFFVPAFVVLPLWFGSQFLIATKETDVSGVAVWAHVGGFAYGMLFGGIFKFAKIEENFINPAVEKETVWKQDDRLIRASEARGRWEFQAAQKEVAALLREQPDHLDGQRAAYEIAIEAEDWSGYGRHAAGLLDVLLKKNEIDLATEHINEAMGINAGALTDRFYLRAGQFMEKQGDIRRALELYQQTAKLFPDEAAGFRALVQVGKLLRQTGHHEAARLTLKKAQSHVMCKGDWVQFVDNQLAQLPVKP